jgi:hypothetical protein
MDVISNFVMTWEWSAHKILSVYGYSKTDIFIQYMLSVYKDAKKRILLYVKQIFLDKKMVCVTSLRQSIQSLSKNWKKIYNICYPANKDTALFSRTVTKNFLVYNYSHCSSSDTYLNHALNYTHNFVFGYYSHSFFRWFCYSHWYVSFWIFLQSLFSCLVFYYSHYIILFIFVQSPFSSHQYFIQVLPILVTVQYHVWAQSSSLSEQTMIQNNHFIQVSNTPFSPLFWLST